MVFDPMASVTATADRTWRATYAGLSDLGDQIAFYGRALGGVPRTLHRYPREGQVKREREHAQGPPRGPGSQVTGRAVDRLSRG